MSEQVVTAPDYGTSADDTPLEPTARPVQVPEAPKPMPQFGLLPPVLAALTKVAAKDVGRYSMTGVHLILKPTGYRAEATDGRRLIRVDCDYPADPENYPEIPGFLESSGGGGGTEVVIPTKVWEKAFKASPRSHYSKPILENIAVSIGKPIGDAGHHLTALGSTDLETVTVHQARPVEGRYPQTDCVFPKESARKAGVYVNPKLLIELLQAMLPFTDPDNNRVEIILNGDNVPLCIKAGATVKAVGLLMPLS